MGFLVRLLSWNKNPSFVVYFHSHCCHDFGGVNTKQQTCFNNSQIKLMGCQNSHQVVELKNHPAELPKEFGSLISKSHFDEAEKQGDELFQKGEILKAITVYQKIIQAHYIHDYDIQGLGNPQHAAGRYQGAVYKWYSQHKQKRNGKGNPYDSLSLCYYSLRGNFQEELKQGIAWYEQMLSQIESYQLYMGYANILANNRKYKEAIAVYNKIIGLKPTLVNSYISISLLDQFKIKKHLEAIGMANRVIALYPQNMYAQFVVAKNIKDPIVQLSSLKALSEKYPNYARIFYEIGFIYEHKQDYNEAISWFKKAIYVLPEYAECYENIGLNLQALNQKEEAVDWYMKACEKNHQIQSPFLKLVTIFENLQFDEAKIEAEIAKHPNLDKFSFYYELGFAYYQNKKIDESLVWYRKAEKLQGSNYKLLNAMGMSFDEKQDYMNGQTYYLHCIRENPKFPDVYYNLTILYNNKKEEQKAKECYLKAVQLNPHFTLVNVGSNDKRQIRPLKTLQSKQSANLPSIGSAFKQMLGPLPTIQKQPETHLDQPSLAIFNLIAPAKNEAVAEDLKITDQEKEVLQILYDMFALKKKSQGNRETKAELAKIIKHIYNDKFGLGHLQEIYKSVKHICKQDEQYFHVIPLILVQYYENKVIKEKSPSQTITAQINIALQTLLSKGLEKNISTGKVSQIVIKMKHFQPKEEPKFNLIKDLAKIKDYQSLCSEINTIEEVAQQNFAEFIDLVQDVRKRSNGVQFIAKTRVPRDKGKLFRYKIQLLQQIFKEDFSEQRCNALIARITQTLSKAGKKPLIANVGLVETEWGKEVNTILNERKKAAKPIEFGVGNMIQGRVVFSTIQELEKSLEITDSICFLRGYEIIGLNNRLANRTYRDVILTIRVQEAICEFRLELRHEDHQNQPQLLELSDCFLGVLIGSYAMLSHASSYPLAEICNDIVEELSESSHASDKQTIEAAKYVISELSP